jgi:hypothetical protein
VFSLPIRIKNKYESMKIVLLTDFSGPANVDQLDSIVAALKSLDIEFMVV